MNEYFYLPLPVACLEIGRTRPNREHRRIVEREMKRREVKWTPGPKQQIPKFRRHKLLRGHNKAKK